MDIYSDLKTAKILEIGSYDVNGSLRDHALPTTHYVGVDMEAGPGVDVVVQAGAPLPFDDESFDLILASSVFEHDAAFWVTFVEMCRKVKSGGYVYINAPSNGTFHRYPEDHWRFYPDSGLALARWAASQGQDMTLVESFVADRSADVYNDFVAIFRKGLSDLPFPDDAIYKNFACWNVHTWRSTELLNPRDDSEDTVLVTKAHQEIEALKSGISVHERRLVDLEGQLDVANSMATDIRAECTQIELQLQEAREETAVFGLALKSAEARNDAASNSHREELNEARQEHAQLEDALRHQLQDKEHQLAQLTGELKEEAEKLAGERAELAQLRDKLALAENMLAQRQEEIEQTRADLAAALEQASLAVEAADNVKVKLQDANEWVFRLAGERRNADAKALLATKRLADVERACARAKASAERTEELLDEGNLKLRSVAAELAELKQENEARADQIEHLRIRNRELRETEAALAASEANAKKQLLERFGEISTLTTLLKEYEEQSATHKDNAEWLQRVNIATHNRPRWWQLMPRSWRRRREHQTLAKMALFDASAYLERYPDVAANGMDPLRHYILHGMAEARQR